MIYLFIVFTFILVGIRQFQANISADDIRKKFSEECSRFFHWQGVDVHVKDEGNGTPILFLHGTSSSLHTWDDISDSLKSNHRIIRLDLIGSGITGPHPQRDYYGMLEYDKYGQADIRLCDWGFRDMTSVIEYACQEFPDHTRHFLGHSIAGQVFPLAENSNKISSACLVASQNVSKKNWSGLSKVKVNLFWYVIVPICIQLFGYVPAAGYGGKHHLHPSIASDWATWGKVKKGF
ncbi:MAG: alpha/beta fold hydrolase [Bacteroidota bacterium]